MLILKFGGTSVGSADNIRKVAEIIQQKSSEDSVTVIVSAVGGVTNKLEKAASLATAGDGAYEAVLSEIEKLHLGIIRSLIPAQSQSNLIGQVKWLQNELEDVSKGVFLLREITPKSKDFILSFGERVSSLVIHSYLGTLLDNVKLLNPLEWIFCDDSYGQGVVQMKRSLDNSKLNLSSLSKVNIMPGFMASSSLNEIITLGRGGSDYSAALLANFLEANKLEIWTDVSGLMTADPRWVRSARTIEHLSYEEALELSHFGAKVIYPPTIQPALERNVPIQIKNTFSPENPGTTITRSWEDTNAIRGISSISSLVLLNLTGSGMVGIPNFSARLFKALADVSVNVVMITQASSEHTICVGIESKDVKVAVDAIHDAFEFELQLHKVNPVEVEEDLAVVALVGTNMRHQVGIAGQMFNTLGQNGVSIKAIAQGSSERNISVVISQSDLKKSVNILHESFFLTETRTVNLFVIGVGNVGQALLEQVRTQQKYLLDHYHVQLKVVALANSKKMVVNPKGIPLDKWTSLLFEGQPYTLDAFLQQMSDYNLRNSIFVDVTASEIVADVYAEVLKKSISVVTPNKIGATSPYQHYKTLKHLAKKFKANYLFETNVCAGLPVISTLNDLIKSGDRIHRIEGVFSGTLNFIFNTYDGDTKFGDIVRLAKNEGYTEPDPRLDLSGEDVMRKILILTRESGHEMDIEQVACEGFVPEACMNAKDIDSFFHSLDENEDHFLSLLDHAKQEGKSLRYVASYFDGNAKAGLELVDDTHPFFQLEGKDNIVLFYTDRYKEQPLVVKGAGAGAEVTASGIFADIMKVANANG
jgi:aspartokinase/homoserine dehydrogenase 1